MAAHLNRLDFANTPLKHSRQQQQPFITSPLPHSLPPRHTICKQPDKARSGSADNIASKSSPPQGDTTQTSPVKDNTNHIVPRTDMADKMAVEPEAGTAQPPATENNTDHIIPPNEDVSETTIEPDKVTVDITPSIETSNETMVDAEFANSTCVDEEADDFDHGHALLAPDFMDITDEVMSDPEPKEEPVDIPALDLPDAPAADAHISDHQPILHSTQPPATLVNPSTLSLGNSASDQAPQPSAVAPTALTTSPSLQSSSPTVRQPILNLGQSVLGNPIQKDKAAARAMQERLKNRFFEKNATRPRADSPLEVMAGSTPAGNSVLEHDHTADSSSPLAENPESELIKARDKYAHLKATHDKKTLAGTATREEGIEVAKCLASLRAFESRHEKLALLAEDDPEEDRSRIFVSEEPETPDRRDLLSENDEAINKNTTRTRKRKQPKPDADVEGDDSPQSKRHRAVKKTAGNALRKGRKVAGHNFTEQDVDNVMIRAAELKAKQNAKPTKPAKAAKKAASKAKEKRTKRKEPTLANVGSLFGTDVFADAEEVANLPSQPKFNEHTTRRAQQLKELVAGMPQNEKVEGHADKRSLDRAIRSFHGTRSVKGVDGSGWLVAGMKTPLKAYQVLGVGFMREREKGIHEPRGGLNADQMGLGKTISTLANIVDGEQEVPPNSKRPTLIIAAPALITQWRDEIRQHCQSKRENPKYGLGDVIEHRAGSRITSDSPGAILSRATIILTTYAEVNKSYPKCIPPPELVTAKAKEDWWKVFYEENKGILHQIEYNRVVIDEAQTIKNHKGHTSQAVRGLSATHHWALSGTPIMNTTKELYPYFQFLKVPHTGSYKIFKDNYCSPDDPDGTAKLAVHLSKFMLRRTHTDTMFNARLLDLPTPKEKTMWLEFNEVERSIYEIVKCRMIQRINAFSKAEGLQKNYSCIWTMILRLRQLCGSILTIQETLGDILEREDFEKLNHLAAAEDETSEQSAMTLLYLRQVLATTGQPETLNAGLGDAVVTSSEAVPSGIIEVDENDQTTVGGKHGLSYRFRKYLDVLKGSDKFDEMNERLRCASCKQDPFKPKLTSCFHTYCQPCLERHQHLSARRGRDSMSCVVCGENFTNVKDLDEDEAEQGRDSPSSSPSLDESLEGAKKRRRPKNKNKTDRQMEDWIQMRGEVLPSTKTTACKAQLMNWFADSPDCKVIVFTQFIPILRILAKVCQTESWTFVTYHGGMSHDARQKSIEEFGDKRKGVQIMLASLKCGGLGLNLTMAQRVICFDPWWNQAVEQQAFCRVYRIGQDKETRLTRFLIKNSIDAAMMAMKERKQIEIDAVMESAKTRLDVKDLMRLFGGLGQDEHGRPFIIPQESGDEHLYHGDDSQDENAAMGNEA